MFLKDRGCSCPVSPVIAGLPSILAFIGLRWVQTTKSATPETTILWKSNCLCTRRATLHGGYDWWLWPNQLIDLTERLCRTDFLKPRISSHSWYQSGVYLVTHIYSNGLWWHAGVSKHVTAEISSTQKKNVHLFCPFLNTIGSMQHH